MIEETGTASRVHQCSHWNLQKGRPDGQCKKIQDHNLPDRGYFQRDIRGDFQSEEHSRGVHVPEASTEEHPCTDCELEMTDRTMTAH